jgi:hypothetical protein
MAGGAQNPFGGKKAAPFKKGTAGGGAAKKTAAKKTVQQAGPTAGRSPLTSSGKVVKKGSGKGSAPFKGMGKGAGGAAMRGNTRGH